MSFVTVTDIFQSYGRRPILERVNLDVEEGAFTSIVGASGCGKSTFLRLLLAQERPTRGEIRVAGKDPALAPGLDRGVVDPGARADGALGRRRRVGVVATAFA